jgi:myo-inositol 2-dehydrogenase / D-chiro-inositol 1-dehydrogenase
MGAVEEPVGVALVGAGRMGAFHAETLARRLPGARLVAVADPALGAARRLAAGLGGARRMFCEKPMTLSLPDADRAIEAARAAGVVLQVAFNRRFAPDWRAARALLDDGRLGTPRLLRSLTRDPGGFDPSGVAPGTIFNETLIHDFDALRFLNPGSEAVEVYATADVLVEPAWRERGLLDTVVVVRFANGATGVAEACFQAAYGYDVRGEVFGSGGMASMGDGRRTGMVFSGAAGRTVETVRSDQELLAEAYVAELAAFVDAASAGTPTPVGGEDARAALAIALAAAESVRAARPVRLEEVEK